MSVNKSILVCQCAERRLLDQEALSALLEQDNVTVIEDLCKAAADKDPILENGFSEVHACHPRAVRALFGFAGHPLPDEVEVRNHRIPSPQQPDNAASDFPPAWYPVIDYDRCTSCGQCHEFCLFGVYTKDEQGRVLVSNPASCKNNCPACARICPETAIIFPKVGETPINGAEVTDEAERQANVKINVDEILGDNVYAALNARKEKRRSLLNRKKIEKALKERSKCSEGNA